MLDYALAHVKAHGRMSWSYPLPVGAGGGLGEDVGSLQVELPVILGTGGGLGAGTGGGHRERGRSGDVDLRRSSMQFRRRGSHGLRPCGCGRHRTGRGG